ncbi:MAG: metallopeptidase TldD-related protein, partial [Bacteroidales bacterium]|nr:metallopeptidase TldD-related protein [Bacteroidales bacterium]
MTKQEKYTLAKWAIQFALDNGADDAKVAIANSIASSIDVRDEKIDKLEQSIEKGLSISLYVNNRYAAASTNRLNKEGLEAFIKQAIDSAQYLGEDEYRQLPPAELYYKGGGKDLKVSDPKFDSIEPEDKINLVKALEQEILGSDERIVSVTTSYFDGYSASVMVTSNGFEGDKESTYFGVGASVSVKSGNARPSAGWYETSVHFDEFKKEGAAKIALKKAIEKIGQQKLASEKLPMLVENEQLSRLLSPLMSAINGASIQQKNSFLLDKKGEQVISSKIS